MSLYKLASDPSNPSLCPSEYLQQLETQLIQKDQQTMSLGHQLSQLENKMLFEREEEKMELEKRDNRIKGLENELEGFRSRVAKEMVKKE
jgi:hypothetical protein